MSPNRGDDDQGFMVWDTDGKKSIVPTISDSHPMAYCMTPPRQCQSRENQQPRLRIKQNTHYNKDLSWFLPHMGRNLQIEQSETYDERISDTF